MIPATRPEALDEKVRALIASQGLQGFLLSGGSNRRNEIRYDRFYPVIEGLKRDFPDLRIAIHTALTDEAGAKRMEAAGVDTAMMDVIGSENTIREVYHLDRPVEDFEATLAALTSTGMDVSPHIVIGLHYGHVRGEGRALKMVARYPTKALVLVVVMPFYAAPGTFETPETAEVGRIFLQAREALSDREVLLGCARPAGMHKRVTDGRRHLLSTGALRHLLRQLQGDADFPDGVARTARRGETHPRQARTAGGRQAADPRRDRALLRMAACDAPPDRGPANHRRLDHPRDGSSGLPCLQDGARGRDL